MEDPHPFFPPLRVLRIVGLVIVGALSAAAFALAFGWLVMLLWNWLMPVLFGLGAIGYWQAFGIVVLAKLVFGVPGGHGRGWHGPRHHWKHGDWGWWEGRPSGPERWRWWREFWEQEGRAAFDRFVERRGDQEKPRGPAGPGGAEL
jgi:hypothetical protein